MLVARFQIPQVTQDLAIHQACIRLIHGLTESLQEPCVRDRDCGEKLLALSQEVPDRLVEHVLLVPELLHQTGLSFQDRSLMV